jgi:hypothetical protein
MADSAPAIHRILDFLHDLSPLWWLILGGLVSQLWIRFRTRTRRFLWKAWHQPIAIAANHPQLGTVTVQYNGAAVTHVHATTVELTNDSSEDQTDIVFTLSFMGQGHIINSTGFVEGDLNLIPFDPNYVALYQGAPPALVEALSTHVIHKIPVLNRRKKATFNLLVRDAAPSPTVQASCNHSGFRLEYVPAVPELYGVPLNLAVLTGLVVTAAIAFLLEHYLVQRHPHFTPWIAWMVGLFSGWIGAMTVSGVKTLLRFIG